VPDHETYYTISPIFFPILFRDWDTAYCHGVSNLRLAGRSGNNATLMWDSDESGPWEVAYGKASAPRDSFSVVNTSVPTVRLSGFDARTPYHAYVRGYCDLNDSYSDWIGPLEFQVYEGPAQPGDTTAIDQPGSMASFIQLLPNPATSQVQILSSYKMDRIVLDEGAKQLLLRYKWPGNVRQLKNITEQISVLSPERTITAQVLSKFIPLDQETTQLAPIHREGGDHSFENEREILYKILFELRGNVNDMRREMSALKKQLAEVQTGSAQVQAPIATTQLAPITAPPAPYNVQAPAYMTEDAVAEEYVEPEKEQENLNLNDLSKQMLEKALERNNGNRKRAAQELGISDRTLYRRLKQYGLDK
jgi:transcriptional regulator with AAA-type ATPase domain